MKTSFLILIVLLVCTSNSFSWPTESGVMLETNEIAKGDVNYRRSSSANANQQRAEKFESKLVSACYQLKEICNKFGLTFPATNSLSKIQKSERMKYRLGSMKKADMNFYESNALQGLANLKQNISMVAQKAGLPVAKLAQVGLVRGGTQGRVVEEYGDSVEDIMRSYAGNNTFNYDKENAEQRLRAGRNSLNDAENKLNWSRVGVDFGNQSKSQQQLQQDVDDARGRVNRAQQDLNNF